MDRAYSVLTVKAVEEEQRIIRGLATSPEPDRLGDIVEPLGVKFKNPMPLLHQHDHKLPVGVVKFEKPTPDGIEFEAKLPKVEEPAGLRDRIETAWGEIKSGLIRGVSIGFRALEAEPVNSKDPFGPQRFAKTEVLELSLVTVPANADAQISLIRSLDSTQRAASGRSSNVERPKHPAGVAASDKPKLKAKKMDAEIITRYQNELVAKTEARNALLEAASKDGRTLDADEDDKFEELASEIKSLSKHLDRLRDIEQAKAAGAKPVKAEAGATFAVVKTTPQLEPGIRFARYAKCKALAATLYRDVSTVAREIYPDDGDLHGMLTQKAAVSAGTAAHATWLGPFVNPLGFADFVEFLRPKTIIGRFGTNGIPSLRRIPFRTPLISGTSGGEAYWVGEGKAKPLTKFDAARTQLDPLKVANIAVATMELLRDSSPSAESYLRDELARAIANRLDIDFINPAKAAAAGVSPASITNGVTPIASEGTDADAVRKDLNAMIAQFTAANNDLADGVFIMPAALAGFITTMVNPLGQTEFPTVSRTGGTILGGFPVIVSNNVPAKTVVLVNASDIYLADEGGVDVAMSSEASLQMDDAPTMASDTPTAIAVVSMFQTNSVAFRAERTINWARRRTVSVSVLNDVDWGGTETP
jgi:HK97 family phage prohead protease